MSNAIVTWLKAELAKFEANDVVQAVETDVEEAGKATLDYIKTNGLQDLYQIALTVVGAALPGGSWTGVLASIEAQAVTDGKQLIQGATAVVAAQAQADLIAAGKLALPTAPTPPAA